MIDVENEIDFTPQGGTIERSRYNPLLIIIMKQIWEWIVRSSADPEEVSLTIKGILIQYVSVILMVGGVLGLHLTETGIVVEIGKWVTYFGIMLSIIGLARKLWYATKPK